VVARVPPEYSGHAIDLQRPGPPAAADGWDEMRMQSVFLLWHRSVCKVGVSGQGWAGERSEGGEGGREKGARPGQAREAGTARESGVARGTSRARLTQSGILYPSARALLCTVQAPAALPAGEPETGASTRHRWLPFMPACLPACLPVLPEPIRMHFHAPTDG
jgi:hypothetical protein